MYEDWWIGDWWSFEELPHPWLSVTSDSANTDSISGFKSFLATKQHLLFPQVNLVFPISFFVICGFLVVLPVYVTPVLVAVDLLILFVGVLVYLVFIRWKRKPAAVQRFLRK